MKKQLQRLTGDAQPIDPVELVRELGPGQKATQLVVPIFDAAACNFRLPIDEEQVQSWEEDPNIRRLELDTVLSCPSCGALPSIRPGCHCCGSALKQTTRLVHHYACAHVAPEDEFRGSDGLTCPKCLRSHLVAGSDFELVPGVTTCGECRTIVNEPTLVCQCLRCLHRFPSEEAEVISITGYEVPRSEELKVVSDPARAASQRRKGTRVIRSVRMEQPHNVAARRRRESSRHRRRTGESTRKETQHDGTAHSADIPGSRPR